MQIITKKDFLKNRKKYLNLIKKGAIFIHATDTIYGLACSAVMEKAVSRLRQIKQRDSKPFSVIAPSKEWIKKNCIMSKAGEKWLKKLPGKYTLILNLKNKKAVSKNVNLGLATIGIRIPKHWTSGIAKELKMPIVTTSANISGKPFMTSMKNLNPSIKKKVDFIIYEGKKASKPSKLVELTSTKARIKER